jgi:Na+-transporting NADH:ubiquinone oxidoreductase, subunit NqrB
MSSHYLDPRLYQIAALTALLTYGLTLLEFDVTLWQILLLLAVAEAAQWIGSRVARIPFDPRSAAISALSLALLFRSDRLILLPLAAALAIASKFVLRIRGKHVFNPSAFAIVVLMLASNHVWVSPGQWGSVAFFAFLIIGLGGLVVHRAARTDVTWAFMAFWIVVLFARTLRLGEPLTIPFHRLESGSLLLFTFFMISDPKTTPDSRIGRIAFAALVAAGAAYVQFTLYRTNGLLWSLAVCSLAVPLIDALIRGARYQWSGGTSWFDASRSWFWSRFRAASRPSASAASM